MLKYGVLALHRRVGLRLLSDVLMELRRHHIVVAAVAIVVAVALAANYYLW